MPHGADYGGQEDGERGECHVSEEEHECCEVTLGIEEGGEHFPGIETGFGNVGIFLFAQAQFSDALFTLGEVRCRLWTVWNGVPGDNGDQHTRESLEEEEQSPGGDRAILS